MRGAGDPSSARRRAPECYCSRLKILNLSNNVVDGAGATAIANGLKNNRKLKAVFLDKNSIDHGGWNALSEVLCDTSSLGGTYSFNHTLCTIASYHEVKIAGSRLYDDDGVIPCHLLLLVKLNGSRQDNNHVAREKILRHHTNNDGFNMESFVGDRMELCILPHVLYWIGKSSDGIAQSAMSNFLR